MSSDSMSDRSLLLERVAEAARRYREEEQDVTPPLTRLANLRKLALELDEALGALHQYAVDADSRLEESDHILPD